MLCKKPPMGWNSWNTFGQDISEELIMGIADAMVEKGLKDAGYEYVVIDDCWSLRERDENGRLVADPKKFPHGMKYLADYIHSKGLKFGMYSCCGTMTCAGYPGSFGHEYVDAKTFAEWEVDYLKYDYCFRPQNAHTPEMGELLYRRMGLALRNSGRDIVYSLCNWGKHGVETWARSVGGHLYRSTGDIQDTAVSFRDIAKDTLKMLHANAPDCFADPDMLICGMYNKGNVSGLGGCTAADYRSHFALWCMMAAPLMIGCDIRNCDEETLDLLKCAALIAIDQDEEVRPPYNVEQEEYDGLFFKLCRHLSDNSLCIGTFNLTDKDRNSYIHLYDVGITQESGYTLKMTDILTGEVMYPQNEIIITHTLANDFKMYKCELVEK